MAHQSNNSQLVQYLKETNVYQNLVESIKSLDECDPKPAKPMEYIAEKIGLKTIGVDEFMALKEDFNRLQDEVSTMRKELTKLKMQSNDDVQDIENNNMPVDQSAMNDQEKSMGLVFGDICFEKFTNNNESYNVFANADDSSLIKKNAKDILTKNSNLVTFCPENRNIFFGLACEIDSLVHETSGIQFLNNISEEQHSDENTSATVSLNEIVPVKPNAPAINASHSTEISAEVNTESYSQSISEISLDQSKTSANDCSHSTEVEADVNVLAYQSDGSASETFNTDESSDIQVFKIITEEHETNKNTSATKSMNKTTPSEVLQTVSAVSIGVKKESDDQIITHISLETSVNDFSNSPEVDAEVNVLAYQSDGSASGAFNSDEISDIQVLEMIVEEHETDENTSATNETNPSEMLQTVSEVSTTVDVKSDDQSITEISLDQSDTSANDCSQSTNVEADMNISTAESIERSCENETNTDGLSSFQILEAIPEENETGENMSATLSSDETIATETGQSVPNSTQEISVEIESDVTNNVSETIENIQKMIRDCFNENCKEMQAAKLPPSDSEDSDVKMSNANQSNEMVTCNIYQQLPNDEVRKMTGLNISDSAECFEFNETLRSIQADSALIMEDVESDAMDNHNKINIESMNQDSSQSSTSSSSSDGKTVVERAAQTKRNEDCPNGISDNGEKVPDSIREVKATHFPHDDIETEFLLSVSSVAQHSIRTFPSK